MPQSPSRQSETGLSLRAQALGQEGDPQGKMQRAHSGCSGAALVRWKVRQGLPTPEEKHQQLLIKVSFQLLAFLLPDF